MKKINVDGKNKMIRHGEGTSIWPLPFDGNYFGYWENDKFHGQGKYTFANGDSWYGTFKDGKANGNGSYYIDGKVIENYKIDDQLHGFAEVATEIQS